MTVKDFEKIVDVLLNYPYTILLELTTVVIDTEEGLLLQTETK